MAELEKEIIGSWFEVRSNIENPLNLREYFSLSDAEISETISRLRNSVEEGITEYKKAAFRAAFNLIESLNYDATSIPQLSETARAVNCATYVILLQRLIAKKAIRLKTQQNGDDEQPVQDGSARQYSITEIGDIIREVQNLVANDPALKTNKNVINVTIQIGKYKRELESMKKIFPNIPADKRDNFKKNYAATINDIFSKLLSSYRALIEETGSRGESQARPQHILETHDMSVLNELLKKQAEISDRIKATFSFADRERFKILETVHTLKPFEKSISELLAREGKHYYNMALSESGKREISRQFCLEIIKILEKQLENRP